MTQYNEQEAVRCLKEAIDHLNDYGTYRDECMLIKRLEDIIEYLENK